MHDPPVSVIFFDDFLQLRKRDTWMVLWKRKAAQSDISSPVISVTARLSPTQPSPMWKAAHQWDGLSKKVTWYLIECYIPQGCQSNIFINSFNIHKFQSQDKTCFYDIKINATYQHINNIYICIVYLWGIKYLNICHHFVGIFWDR